MIEKLSVVPTNQRPGVASLSSATASLVKELSDSLLLSMAPFHLRTLTDNAESTASTIAVRYLRCLSTSWLMVTEHDEIVRRCT